MRRLGVLLLLGCDEGEPAPVATTTLVEQDFGVLLADPATDAVAIDIEPGTPSLTLVAESDAEDLLAIELLAPGGEPLIRADDPAASPNPALPGVRVAVAQVPIRPEVELLPGRYLLRVVYSGLRADVRLRAFLKRPAAQALDVDMDGQIFDIALLFATPAVEPGDAALDRAVDTAAALLAGARLDLAFVSEHVLQDAGAVTGDGPETERLLERFAGLAEGAVPVFIVEDILSGVPASSLAGLTATVPLPPVDGTPRSGVLLSALALRKAPAAMGRILAHEIGHALGLLHTSEPDGAAHDPLADTPECPAERDGDGDGAVRLSECAGRGAENLMFWQCCATGRPVITPDQRFVMLRSALTR